MIEKDSISLTSTQKPHFEILDGLRGIAAIVVVIYHFMEIAITNYNLNFIAHGYLAVDFFFCLSGFVIAYAYDSRVEKMGFKAFFRARLIRLQPMVIIGSILGLLTFLFDPYSDFFHTYGLGRTALILITSLLLLPYPVMPERSLNLFSLNAPAWSLFWEYIANILYAIVLYKLSRKILLGLCVLGSIGIWVVAIHAGNLGGGWGGPNFADGIARVFYSFLAGMMIYRSNWIIKNKLGFLGVTALLLLLFLVPYSDRSNWYVEPIIVLFFLPLLVSLGAGTTLSTKLGRLCKLSGDISYPLYMTHYPFVWIFLTYCAVVKPTMEWLKVLIPVSVSILILFAYLVMVFIDKPLRAYLSKRIVKNSE